jgi:DNA-binding MarR family transcriptional regulator
MTRHDDAYRLEPALDFLQHLWRVNHATERLSLQMERRLGVTAQQRVIVRCIGKYPGLTPSRLAEVLHLDRGTVSAALSRLATKGLVVKRPDPRDSRRIALGLTPEGRRLDAPRAHDIEEAVDAVLGEAGAADVAAAKAVLASLAARLASLVPLPHGL